MDKTSNRSNALAPALVGLWAIALVAAFLAYRGDDTLKLGSLIGSLGGGPLAGRGVIDSILGSLCAGLVVVAWFGLGTLIARWINAPKSGRHSHVLELAGNVAIGAAAWSVVWFLLGVIGGYSAVAAAAVTATGIVFAILGIRRVKEATAESRVPERAGLADRLLLALIAAPIALAFIAALAAPTAKDTLLYHFAVPKAFIAQGSSAYVAGNIASYLSLAAEMHVVWARLLGGLVGERAAEVAGSVVLWTFFPLLLAAIFGWARETNVSRRLSLIAVLIAASIPTAYHVASSGYIDLALALFITLAIYWLGRWWNDPSSRCSLLIAIFLGAALSVKLTAAFAIAAFALVILLRARSAKDAGRMLAAGLGALVLALVIASPAYLRTWAATGSPVFPFYMSIWPGKADGWDVERSNLFQAMNSQYGGADVDQANYLTAPVRVSVAAQPEQPANYDGVLGVSFLIGLPLLLWGLWKLELPVEAKIAADVAGVMYLFWLFSSAQLRYLLPIAPSLAVAIAASADVYGEKLRSAWTYAFAASSAAAIATSFAWFCQKAPLRAALGGETREQYLSRNLDHYPYYQALNSETASEAKIWLINMRRDTYNIERPVFADYLFEDWTLRKLLWESRDIADLRGKAAALGVNYVLARHDFLFDYDRSTLVDDERPRAENEAKLRLAKQFILDPATTVRSDGKFSLARVF